MYKRMLANFVLLLACSLAATPGMVHAAWEPGGSITVKIMFPAGGGGDILARAITSSIEKHTGWNLVVENRRGGGGATATREVMASDPDGLTIGMAVTETFGFIPVMNPNAGFTSDSVTQLGAVAITQVGLIANADARWNSLEDVIADARNGEKINVGVFSPGSTASVKALAAAAGIELTTVPVKSGKEGVVNVMAGQLDLTLAAGPQAPFIRKGEAKVLASFESDRLLLGSEAKTVAESGYQHSTQNNQWLFFAPKNIPEDARTALEAALVAVANDENLRSLVEEKMGFDLIHATPAEVTDANNQRRKSAEVLIQFMSKK